MLDLDYKEVAERYGGNKQKIAQAAAIGALGPEGPLLAVTAGMYIDRMRAAQVAEQAPQQTVAQQVLAPQPQMPPQGAPMPQGGPPQGLGAIAPQGGDMPMPPPQEMGMPMPEEMQPGLAEAGMPMPEEAAPEMVSMAAGGLADLSVPDDMFDEPNNGGYADGGLVAFAGGGPSWASAPMTSRYGVKRSTGTHQGNDYAIPGGTPLNPLAGGVVVTASRDKINGNFVVIRHPNGYTTSYSHLSKINVAPGQQIGAGDVLGLSGNTGRVRGKGGGYHLHFGARDPKGNRVDPSSLFGKIQSLNQGSAAAPASSGKGLGAASLKLPERDTETAQGRYGSLKDQMQVVNELYGELPEDKGRDLLKTYYEGNLDPKQQAKARKDDMWATLAQIGASMASSNSPYFLQAVGQAIGSALPGAEASRKERKAVEREAVTALSELYGWDRKEAKEKLGMALDLRNVELRGEEAEEARRFAAAQADKEIGARKDLAALQHGFQMQEIGAQASAQERLQRERPKEGIERIAEVFYNMGYNEKKNKGLPIDSNALWAEAYRRAYSMKPTTQQGWTPNGIPPLNGAGAASGDGIDFNSLPK